MQTNNKFFDDIESLKPVINSGNSDSAALDNVFELLVRSGKSVSLAKLMLIPDAWSKRRKTVSKSHQNLFNFLNSTIEPPLRKDFLLNGFLEMNSLNYARNIRHFDFWLIHEETPQRQKNLYFFNQ